MKPARSVGIRLPGRTGGFPRIKSVEFPGLPRKVEPRSQLAFNPRASLSHAMRRHSGTVVPYRQLGNPEMTTPSERTRALVWGGGFLIEVARDTSLPLALRRKAATIARHFPTIEQIASTSSFPPSPEPAEVCRDDLTSWGAELQHGPLKESTGISWPEG